MEDTGAGLPSLAVRRHRLELLCRAYAGAGDRVAVGEHVVVRTTNARREELAAFTAARAAAGVTRFAAHVQAYRDDARCVEEHLEDLALSGDVAQDQQLGH